MINYGMRSGGGIGDVIPKISSKYPEYFIQIFFFNVLFHIIVILILGNMFFGLILDSFNDLRDKLEIYENDIKNVCFVCQIDSDNYLFNNKSDKSFEKHKKEDHYLWNYLYFITYIIFLDKNANIN